ncbi:MAG: phosphotransferase [Sinobacteraceae bacterium]|nr:phosphotransferase [Nevskiaceae bacterium]
MIPAAALAAVPGAVDAGATALRIEPLPGGLLNRSFRIATAAGVFVLRLNADAAQAEALGADRSAELEAQRLAAAVGLAPTVVAAADDHSFLVTRYVTGERVVAETIATEAGLRRWGATMTRLRTLLAWQPTGSGGDVTAGPAVAVPAPDALPALRAGASLIERARRLVLRARVGARPLAIGELEHALELAERGWECADAGRGPRCLVHSDPHPDNVLWVPGEGSLVLVDWEYAHLGHPLQDPAAWLLACPALRGREAQLLRACGLEWQADTAMLEGMLAVYALLERAWRMLVKTAAGAHPGGRAN